jgi:hypothetical protein
MLFSMAFPLSWDYRHDNKRRDSLHAIVRMRFGLGEFFNCSTRGLEQKAYV